jgi:hypothetical protein
VSSQIAGEDPARAQFDGSRKKLSEARWSYQKVTCLRRDAGSTPPMRGRTGTPFAAVSDAFESSSTKRSGPLRARSSLSGESHLRSRAATVSGDRDGCRLQRPADFMSRSRGCRSVCWAALAFACTRSARHRCLSCVRSLLGQSVVADRSAAECGDERCEERRPE